MKIVKECDVQTVHWEQHFKGGAMDGETFRIVEVELEDGTLSGAWVSNSRPGYFRQVFVPYESDHPVVLER